MNQGFVRVFTSEHLGTRDPSYRRDDTMVGEEKWSQLIGFVLDILLLEIKSVAIFAIYYSPQMCQPDERRDLWYPDVQTQNLLQTLGL